MGRKTTLLKGLSLLFFLLAWHAISLIYPPSIVPGPAKAFETLVANYREGILLVNLGETVKRVFFGFAGALVFGTVVGIAMGSRKSVAAFFDLPTMILLAIPSLAWAIIGLMWFGLSELAAIFVIAVIGFPLVVINVYEGVKNVDKLLIEMAEVYKAGRGKKVVDIVLPSIFPYILAGSRYGIGVAWKIAIIAEMLGMPNGVGRQLQYNYTLFRMDQVLAWTVAFTVVILVIDEAVFKRVERLVMAWRPAVSF